MEVTDKTFAVARGTMQRSRTYDLPTEKSLWYMRWVFLVGLAIASYSQDVRGWYTPVYLVLALAVAGNLAFAPPLFSFPSEQNISRVKLAAWLLDIAVPLVWALSLPVLADQWAFWILLYPIWAMALRSDWFWGLLLGGTLLLGYVLRVLIMAGNLPANMEELLSTLRPQAPTLYAMGLAAVLASLIAHISVMAASAEEAEEKRILMRDHRQARAFRALSTALSVPDSFHNLLHALAEATCDYLGNKDWKSLLLLFDKEGDSNLRVVAGANYRIEDEHAQISSKTGILQQVLLEGVPAIIAEPDPLMASLASLRGARTMVILPLQSGFDEYGALILASADKKKFDTERLELLKSLCQLSALVLHNVQLHQDLQRVRDGSINEEEVVRRQLARNLHDGPVQTVAAIAMQIEYIKALLQREPDQVPLELDDLYEMARKASHSMRTMLFTLRPVVLETEGLSSAIQHLVTRLKEESYLDIYFDDMAAGVRLRAEAEETAFAILEEAISNAKKHAPEARIVVRLLVDGDFLVAQVEDNGPGFDVASMMESYHERMSLGMLNMKERAALIDAHWNVDSAPGKGTLVSLAIPITTHHRDFDASTDTE